MDLYDPLRQIRQAMQDPRRGHGNDQGIHKSRGVTTYPPLWPLVKADIRSGHVRLISHSFPLRFHPKERIAKLSEDGIRDGMKRDVIERPHARTEITAAIVPSRIRGGRAVADEATTFSLRLKRVIR